MRTSNLVLLVAVLAGCAHAQDAPPVRAPITASDANGPLGPDLSRAACDQLVLYTLSLDTRHGPDRAALAEVQRKCGARALVDVVSQGGRSEGDPSGSGAAKAGR